MGMFSGIREAKMPLGGIYVLEGAYKVRVDACKAGQTRKKQDFFVSELHILESNNPKRPVGTKMSWIVTFDKEPALGNVKAFVVAVMGVKPEEVDEAGLIEIVSERNPLKGKVLRLSASQVKTKAGNDFTRCVWEAVEEAPAAAASSPPAAATA